MMTSREPRFYERFGVRRTGDPERPFAIEPCAALCRRGVLRAAVVASAIDIAGSLQGRAAAGIDPIFTLDLSLRAPVRACPGAISTRSELRRSGRHLITTALHLEADGEPWAFGETTFLRLPARDPKGPPPEALPDQLDSVPLERPLAEEAGIELADASRGRVELVLRPALLSPAGTLSGSLFGLLVETAAEALAEHALGEPRVVSEIDLRYLSAGRRGPMVSQAAWVGAPDDGMIRVELRDAGADDRLAASAFLRTARPPAV
jgi:acyl-coenzyme A thioesterase PaaI-like protein